MRFDLSSPLGMVRVTGKYIGVGYEDSEDKTRFPPRPIVMLSSESHSK